MSKEKNLTKAQIRKIAKEYGFFVEFSDMYDTFPTTTFGRINKDENWAYFSGKAKSKDGEPIVFQGVEEDRFEQAEQTHKYFKYWRDAFWKAYPEFKNHKPG